jgi:hypothetical protein
MKANKRGFVIIMIIFFVITIPAITLQAFKSFKIAPHIGMVELSWVDLSLRIVFLTIDLYMLIAFLNDINFFKSVKLKRIRKFNRDGKLANRHKAKIILIYTSSSLYYLNNLLSLNYPLLIIIFGTV